MAIKTIIGTIGIAIAASTGTALFFQQSSSSPKEAQDPWSGFSESMSEKEEALARYRFDLWSQKKQDVTNKKLLRWDDKKSWIKKVEENATNKDVWPESLIFVKDRSTVNLAHLLRKNCYNATVLWSRQVNDSGEIKEEAKQDFKDVKGHFQDSNYAQLCATNTVNKEDSKTTKVQVSSTKWTKLENYLSEAKYEISDSINENSLIQEAKEFVANQKKEYTSYDTKTAIKKMVIGVTVFSDETTLFESKYTGNRLFNDLKEVPVLKNVLVEKKN